MFVMHRIPKSIPYQLVENVSSDKVAGNFLHGKHYEKFSPGSEKDKEC